MKHSVKDLAAKNDDELLDMLGFKNQLEEFKSALDEAQKLEGKAKEIVEERVNDMLSPRIYPGDLKHTVESAKRQAARKTAKGEQAYCGCDILD